MSSSSEYPQALAAVISALERLPGIGRRTAERLTLALLDWPEETLSEFGQRLARLRTDVRTCEVCGNLADGERCRICRDASRDQAAICVVEEATQIPTIERSGCYHGLYHVLGGRLEPLAGTGPEELNLDALRQRIAEGQVTELILATGSDVEGEATAAFLADELGGHGLNISRIASGIPVGADLSYADSATVAMAINRRRPVR
jgi:recombination protein RecR